MNLALFYTHTHVVCDPLNWFSVPLMKEYQPEALLQWECIWLSSSCYSCPKYNQAYLFLNVDPAIPYKHFTGNHVGWYSARSKGLWAWCVPGADALLRTGLVAPLQAAELSLALSISYQIGVINKWFQTNPFYSMLWPWASHLNSLSLSPLMYKWKLSFYLTVAVSEKKKLNENCLLNFKVTAYNYNSYSITLEGMTH